VSSSAVLSANEARWLAIAAQGLGAPRRGGRVDRRHVMRTIDRVGALQLDAINVLERTQFVVLFSRLGAYPKQRLHDLVGPAGALFESAAHAAALIPMAMQPLMRWRMERHGKSGGKWGEYERAYELENREYIAAIFDEVRDSGPIAASALTDPRPNQGEWWGRRSDGRRALEWLLGAGRLVAWRTPSFERVYDIPERVLPPEILASPTPPVDDAHRTLIALAARSLGVGTVADLADYYRLKQTPAKARIAELVEAGDLVAVCVEGWPQPGYMPAEASPRPPTRDHATLLSPFDSLIWERARTARLFGFDYRIEVYVPAPKRVYGYYVLPLLVGDQLVGRLDLKANRQASVLEMRAAHLEPAIARAGTSASAAAAAARVELDAMADWLGLERVSAPAPAGFWRQ